MSSYLVGLAHSWLMFVLDGSWRDPTSFLTLTCFQGLGRGAGCPPTPLSDPKCILCLGSVGGDVRVKDHASCLQSLTVFLVFAASTILSPFYVFFGGVTRGGSRGGREGVQDIQAHGSFGIGASLVIQRPTADVGVEVGSGWAGPLDLSH